MTGRGRGPGGPGRPGAAIAVLTVVLFGTVAGCGPAAGSGAASRTELRVAAAASLRTATAALAAAYAVAHPDIAITVATGSSAALRTQIEQGAPIDVFLSADLANPRALVDDGLAAGDPVPIAANAVALVVPADNPAGIAAPADLARPGLRIVAAGSAVPITAYVGRVIANLAGAPGVPAGYAAAVEANTVSREDSVAGVLAKVELGEGDAGFVYSTDAAGSGKVRSIPIPVDANVRVADAGVVVGTTRHAEEAVAFLTWVASPAGQAILGPLGFLAP